MEPPDAFGAVDNERLTELSHVVYGQIVVAPDQVVKFRVLGKVVNLQLDLVAFEILNADTTAMRMPSLRVSQNLGNFGSSLLFHLVCHPFFGVFGRFPVFELVPG